MRTCDVAVAGAGIVGAACARALAAAGLRVTVVEPAFVGSGATAAGMGHVVAMDDSDAQFALTRYSQQLWDELAEQLPRSAEWQRCGTVWIAADEDELALVARKREYYNLRGVAADHLDQVALYGCEPNLRPGLVGGLLVPADSVLYPPAAAAWLLNEAERAGANVRTGCAIAEVRGRDLRLTNGDSLSCSTWINAAGTAAARLCPGVPIRPRKGHLVITDRYPNFIRHQLVELGYLKSAHGVANESVAFNVQPRITGQIIIGSSRQFDVTHKEIDVELLQRMLRRAAMYVPRIGELTAIRSWTGFRAATPDSLPLIGPWPPMAGCYLATGHEGLGITTSLATAELITAHLLQRRAGIPAEPYLPERFLHTAHSVIERTHSEGSSADE